MCSQFPQIAVVSATVDLFTIWSVSDTAEGVHEPAGCAPVAALPHRICEKVDVIGTLRIASLTAHYFGSTDFC